MKKIDEHKGWIIYRTTAEYICTVKGKPTGKTLPHYIAVKNNRVIEGVDIPDLLADINEAER